MTKTYDYIVVGSGPAGAVAARTLADGGASVLLLEAGADSDGDELIKSANSNLYDHIPEYFWEGQSVPQKNTNNKPFNLTGGRVAGGGSSVNGEMYVRPTPYVLRQWEKAGGPQWSPGAATQNFTELEAYHGDSDDLSVHGKDGLLHIRQTYQRRPAFADKLVNAIEQSTGLRAVEDYNNPATPIGPFYRWQLYQKPNGDRASASVCFLPGKADVHYQSTAIKVLFNENREAEGVVYLENGREKTALAAEQVVVCAGIFSTKLLMLSGVGPEEVLKRAGVPVVYPNENVGKGLAGDAYVGAAFTVREEDVAELRQADPNGKFASGAFLPAPGGPEDQRSIQFIPSQVFGNMLYMSVLCVNPKSRGSLRIQSGDPLKIMLGDFGFLTDPQDIQTLKTALREYIAKMGDALSKNDSAYRLVGPPPDALADDRKLEQYIRGSFIHTYHDQCSLKMGAEQDGGAVDGFGAVHGVKKLTVADASVIPYHMDGNTSASAYLIGYTIAKHLLGRKQG